MTTQTYDSSKPLVSDEGELNKRQFEAALRSIFIRPVFQCEHGTLLAPGEGQVPHYEEVVHPLLQEEGVEFFEDAYKGADLMSFSWDSDMPVSWGLTLSVFSVRSRIHYLYLTGDVLDELSSHCRIIARIEGKLTRALMGEVFRALMHENGKSFHVDFFGSLPTDTTNHAWDLFGEEVVKQVYREWMNWMVDVLGGGHWSDLVEEAGIIEPDEGASAAPLSGHKEVFGAVKDVGGFAAYEKLQGLKDQNLSQSEKQDILDRYFERSYKTESSENWNNGRS